MFLCPELMLGSHRNVLLLMNLKVRAAAMGSVTNFDGAR